MHESLVCTVLYRPTFPVRLDLSLSFLSYYAFQDDSFSGSGLHADCAIGQVLAISWITACHHGLNTAAELSGNQQGWAPKPHAPHRGFHAHGLKLHNLHVPLTSLSHTLCGRGWPWQDLPAMPSAGSLGILRQPRWLPEVTHRWLQQM